MIQVPPATTVVSAGLVSDADGTLTSSANAFFETVVVGSEPGARSGAAHAKLP